jgi:hypothetical protein
MTLILLSVPMTGAHPVASIRLIADDTGVPIVFNQHYIGTMDYWDPSRDGRPGRAREVIHVSGFPPFDPNSGN